MKSRNKGVRIDTWASPELAADVQRIADRRTGGNRSEAVRHLLAWAVRSEQRGHVVWLLSEDGYEAVG